MFFRWTTMLAALLCAVPALALDDPLDSFSEEAGVVIRLSPPAEISAKAKVFLQKAAPQFAQISDQLAPGLGSLIGNPTLAGIDADRDWYIAVLPRQEQPPAVLFAAPTNDAAALKKAVGQGYVFKEVEDWVVYSRNAEAVNELGASDDRAAKSIRQVMAEPLAKIFAEGELGMFFNVPTLREAYRPQIEQAKGQFLRAAAQGAGPNGASQLGTEYNRQLFEGLLKAIDQTAGFAKHIVIGEDAIEADAVALVEPGSDAANFLAKQTPSNFPLLEKLPPGRLVYYAIAGDFSDLISASVRMSLNLYSDAEELKEKIAKLDDVRFEELAGLFELGDLENGVYRGSSLVKVDSPDEYLSLAREIAASMTHVEMPGLQQDVTFTRDAETIEGVKIDVMRIVMTPDLKSDPTGSSRKLLQIMFGEDGMTQRFAVVDGVFVQAVGEEMMKPAIEAVKGGASTKETPAGKAAASTRAVLGGDANLLLIYDLPRTISEALQLAIDSKQLPLPLEPAALENLKIAPSYTGVTMVAGENEVRIRGVMPAEQVQGLVAIMGVLQQAAPQRNRAN